MGNQALTPTTTSILSIYSLTNVSQPLINTILRVTTTDETGKVFSPTPNQINFKEISQEGISFSEKPLVFPLLKHPQATHFKITLESKGTFSNSILGQSFFSLKNFKLDEENIFDLNIEASSGQIIASLSVKLFVPGPIFERKLLLQFSIENNQMIKQIHFKHAMSSSLSNSEQMEAFFGIIEHVIEFCDQYSADMEVLDITTSPSLIQPLCILTLKFKDSFIEEAFSNEEKNLNEKGELIIPCFERSSLQMIENLKSKNIQTKIFYQTCEMDLSKVQGYLKASESVHSRNIIQSVKFLQDNKDKIELISKNFEWTTDGNKSICILWFKANPIEIEVEKLSLLEKLELQKSVISTVEHETEKQNEFDTIDFCE
jgi:hypothetical protein